MSLDDINNKIISDAKLKADEIKKESELETKKKIDTKEADFKDSLAKLEEQINIKATRLKDQSGFQVRMIEKNALLKARQEEIENVFESAKEKLANLEEGELLKFYVKILKAAPILKKAKIVTNNNRKEVVKKALAKANLNYSISDEHLEKGKSGMVLISDSIEIDLTIGNLLGQKKDEIYNQVADILFT